MPLIRIPAGELYVEVHGTGAPVLLVPGLGGRAQFWAAQVAALSTQFQVILHDHRGVGRSRPGHTARSIGELADDVLGLMDALGLPQAHYVGHSTGGAMGQHLALVAPERIGRLVLSCTWAGPDPLFVQAFETRAQVLRTCGPEAYLMMGTLMATPGWHLQAQFAASRSFLADRVRDFPGVETELARIGAVVAHDLRARLGAVRHRPLVIGARDDQITPPGFSEELARLIPNSHLVVLPEGGHFAPMVVPEVYNRHLLTYLTA
jgi:aminoacrylate hydrolase